MNYIIAGKQLQLLQSSQLHYLFIGMKYLSINYLSGITESQSYKIMIYISIDYLLLCCILSTYSNRTEIFCGTFCKKQQDEILHDHCIEMDKVNEVKTFKKLVTIS